MKVFERFLVLALIMTPGLVFHPGITKAEEPEVYKIGVILPLTGKLAAIGENAKNGIDLALKKVNSGGGIRGKKVKVIFEDSKAFPKDAVDAANKLINFDKVKFIVGAIASPATLAIAPIAERNKVILVSPGTSSPKLSEAGEYIFRTWHSASYEGKYFGQILYEKFGVKNIGILYANTEYGVGLLSEFKNIFTSKGGNIIFEEGFEQNQANFRSILSKLRNQLKQLDAVYLIAYYSEAGRILKQSREMQMKILFFCSDAVQDKKLIDIAGSTAEGIIYPHVKQPDSSSSAVKDFRENYRKHFGKEYGPTSDTAYDALNLILSALNKVGYNSELAKDVLKTTENYEGASGLLSFDENGDILKEMELKTVKNGLFVVLEETGN